MEVSAALGPGTHVGPVELTVSDLDRMVAFYQDALGLRVLEHAAPVARLGAGERVLVIMHEESTARRDPVPHAGLFHLALVYPTRDDLALALVRLARVARGRLTGASDHGVSEALYLDDPEDNGIELYVDRPREAWPPTTREDELVHMFTAPLELEDLVEGVRGQDPPPHAPEGLVMGHMHLHVGDLDASTAFYRDVVGLDVTTTYPGATFLAAGGYHHHLGINTWAGTGAPPQPAGTTGLRAWELIVDEAAQLEIASRAAADVDDRGVLTLRDPSENVLRISGA